MIDIHLYLFTNLDTNSLNLEKYYSYITDEDRDIPPYLLTLEINSLNSDKSFSHITTIKM